MKFAHVLMCLALLTASCDVILTLEIAGTIRFSQLMLVGVIVCALVRVLQTRTVLWPRGGYALAIWCIVQGVLIAESPAPIASVLLYAILVLSLLGIGAALQLYGRSPRIDALMNVYLYSYVIVAFFGAVQFVAPALHLGHPLIVQWIVVGLVPRINGFSYEPSYFATYLIMGWIVVIDLRVSGAALTQPRRWFWFLLLLSAILFLSTSKTAWLLMIGEGLARFFPLLWRRLRHQAGRLLRGSWVVELPNAKVLLGAFAVASFLVLSVVAASRVVDLNIFLSGTGIDGTAAHSLNDRISGFSTTLQVIQMHFWVGRSLGGVPATIAQLHGAQLRTLSDLRAYWGFPVPLEVFAASGFWGFLPFLWFFLSITIRERKLIRQHAQDERAKWLRALIRGLVFEWLALFADQNLLRVYLWFHVTMVVIVGYNLRYWCAESDAAARSPAAGLGRSGQPSLPSALLSPAIRGSA